MGKKKSTAKRDLNVKDSKTVKGGMINLRAEGVKK